MEINNTADLLQVIRSDKVTPEEAINIVQDVLNVVIIYTLSKKELIAQTENYIENFCKNEGSDRPLFLFQKQNEFSIKDLYATNLEK